jgi:hypothetical protein
MERANMALKNDNEVLFLKMCRARIDAPSIDFKIPPSADFVLWAELDAAWFAVAFRSILEIGCWIVSSPVARPESFFLEPHRHEERMRCAEVIHLFTEFTFEADECSEGCVMDRRMKIALNDDLSEVIDG